MDYCITLVITADSKEDAAAFLDSINHNTSKVTVTFADFQIDEG